MGPVLKAASLKPEVALLDSKCHLILFLFCNSLLPACWAFILGAVWQRTFFLRIGPYLGIFKYE